MTTTACDDQFAPDPSSRDVAIEAIVKEVQPHEWRQGGVMRYQGHLITWGEYMKRRRVMTEGWHQAQDDLADAWDAGEKRIDTTIDQYRETKERMQAIIDRHMSEAFDEIRSEFGTTPTVVNVGVRDVQTIGEKYPSGVYAGCLVTLGGES